MRKVVIAAISSLVFSVTVSQSIVVGEGLHAEDFHSAAPWLGYETGGVIKPDPDSELIVGAVDGVVSPYDFKDEKGRPIKILIEQWFMVRKGGTPPMGTHRLRSYPNRTPMIDRKHWFARNMAWTSGDFPDWKIDEKRTVSSFFEYFRDIILHGATERSRYGFGLAVAGTDMNSLFSSIKREPDEKCTRGVEQEYEIAGHDSCKWSVFSCRGTDFDPSKTVGFSTTREILQAKQGKECLADKDNKKSPPPIVRLKRSGNIRFSDWEHKVGHWPSDDRWFARGVLLIWDSVPTRTPDFDKLLQTSLAATGLGPQIQKQTQ